MSEEKLSTFEETGGENDIFSFDLQRFADPQLSFLDSSGKFISSSTSSIGGLSVGGLSFLTFSLGIAEGYAIGKSTVASDKQVDGKVLLLTAQARSGGVSAGCRGRTG